MVKEVKKLKHCSHGDLFFCGEDEVLFISLLWIVDELKYRKPCVFQYFTKGSLY